MLFLEQNKSIDQPNSTWAGVAELFLHTADMFIWDLT
jgi:hypothetical protein